MTRDTARPDDPPYDRDLIRSGSASRRGDRRQQTRAPRTASRRATRARRGRSFLRTIRNVLLIALLAVIVGAVLLGMRAAAFNATVSSAAFPSTQLLGPLNGSDRVNVLMVGYGGPGHDGAYLADSIQILSIDPETDTTVTIPIPRDLWIEGIAALPQNGKVNEVFAQGYINGDESLDTAGALMTDVLSTVTGLEIHHWLSIDFTGFRDMVDAVGGVTINNPVAFSYTTNERGHRAGRWNTGHFDKGEIHLDGKTAARLLARAVHERRVGVDGLRAIGSPGPGPRRVALERRGRRHRRDRSRPRLDGRDGGPRSHRHVRDRPLPALLAPDERSSGGAQRGPGPDRDDEHGRPVHPHPDRLDRAR